MSTQETDVDRVIDALTAALREVLDDEEILEVAAENYGNTLVFETNLKMDYRTRAISRTRRKIDPTTPDPGDLTPLQHHLVYDHGLTLHGYPREESDQKAHEHEHADRIGSHDHDLPNHDNAGA